MIEYGLTAVMIAAAVLAVRFGWAGIVEWQGSRQWRYEKVEILNTLRTSHDALIRADDVLSAAGIIPARPVVADEEEHNPDVYYLANIGNIGGTPVAAFTIRAPHAHGVPASAGTHKAERA